MQNLGVGSLREMCFSVDHSRSTAFVCLEPEEWKANAELKARTVAQKAFVTWPADESGKKKKASSTGCKLNKCLLQSVVGRAELDRRLISVPVLEHNLQCLKEHWKVP